MKLYEGGYRAFKKCLVDAWPNGKVEYCAHMVMIDVRFPIHLIDFNWCVLRDINAFILSINMPQAYVKANVSTYLATYYPQTSAALFEGKSKSDALKIILAEKANKKDFKNDGSLKQIKKAHQWADNYITIQARSLSKKHDWNTVK